MGVNWLERIIDRVSKEIPEQEEEKPKWESQRPDLAKHVSKDTQLMTVHFDSGEMLWLQVEERVEVGNEVYFIGHRRGVINSDKIGISGDTKVRPVEIENP
jgi:hypothetical protein